MSGDRQLIEQVLAGKTESFADLVSKYQDRLYNTLVHATGSTHEAEEVTQDAMLQAYTKLATFRGASSFYTWLYRIAFNLLVSRRRKARPRLSLNELRMTAGIDPTDETEGPEDAAERSERAEHLLAAMDRIGEEHRVVLVLREMEDCDYETISSMLEIPVGTVRSRLHRARTQLRNQLKQMIGEHE